MKFLCADRGPESHNSNPKFTLPKEEKKLSYIFDKIKDLTLKIAFYRS